MTDFSVRLGRRVRELRVQRRLSQDQVAEQAEISGKYVGEIERGEVNVSAFILSKIAAVLQVEIAELFVIDHHASREKLEQEILLLLAQAEEEKFRLAYRILQAVLP